MDLFAQRGQWGNLVLALAATGLKLPRDLLVAALAGRRGRARPANKVAPEIEQAWTELLQSLQRRLEELNPGHGHGLDNVSKAAAHAN
jgi:hypothetical protein